VKNTKTKITLAVLPLALLAGCFQSGAIDSSRFDLAQRLSPTAFVQNATMSDTSVHEDPDLLRAGVPREQITAAFGAPNDTSNAGGQTEDEYEFNPDGSKFVKPKIYARNIAAGIFTGGAATVAHQVRIHHTEAQLTVYHLTYGPDDRVATVRKEARDTPADATTAASQQPPSP